MPLGFSLAFAVLELPAHVITVSPLKQGAKTSTSIRRVAVMYLHSASPLVIQVSRSASTDVEHLYKPCQTPLQT